MKGAGGPKGMGSPKASVGKRGAGKTKQITPSNSDRKQLNTIAKGQGKYV